MSSIANDIFHIIDRAGADPTFTEVFSRLGYATYIEVENALRGLERNGLILSYYCPSMRHHRQYFSSISNDLIDEIDVFVNELFSPVF